MPGTLPLLVAAGLLAAAVVLFVLHPLVKGLEAPLEHADDDPVRVELEHRRRVALGALRDAEYDFATGKLDEDDYRHLRGELAREALALLEREGPDERSDAAPGEGTEEDVAARRSLDPLEAEIARIRTGLREGRTCRSCAHVNPAGSRFCGRCGASLGREDRVRVGAGGAGDG